MQTPTPTHEKFDQLCEPIDEFEYLPVYTASATELDPEAELDGGEHTLDEQILTGLVCPV